MNSGNKTSFINKELEAILKWLEGITFTGEEVKDGKNLQIQISLSDLQKLAALSDIEEITNFIKYLNKEGIEIFITKDLSEGVLEPYLNRKKYGANAEKYFYIGYITTKNREALRAQTHRLLMELNGVIVPKNDSFIFSKSKFCLYYANKIINFDKNNLQGRIMNLLIEKHPTNDRTVNLDEVFEDCVNIEKQKKSFSDACRLLNKSTRKALNIEYDIIKLKKSTAEFLINIKIKK